MLGEKEKALVIGGSWYIYRYRGGDIGEGTQGRGHRGGDTGEGTQGRGQRGGDMRFLIEKEVPVNSFH